MTEEETGVLVKILTNDHFPTEHTARAHASRVTGQVLVFRGDSTYFIESGTAEMVEQMRRSDIKAEVVSDE